MPSRKFPLFRILFHSTTFFLHSSSNTLPLSFSLRSKRTSAKDTSPSLRSPDSHIISPACPWRCNKPSEFTGELWERRCKHKTQEYPVYSPAYCTRRPWGFVVLEVGDGRTGWERERYVYIGLERGRRTRCAGRKDRERNTWIWLWGSVQVLRSAIVFELIVRGCSSSALDTFHDGTHGS